MKPLLLAPEILVGLIVNMVVIGALLPKQRAAAFNAIFRTSVSLISRPQDWRTDLNHYKLYRRRWRHKMSETDSRGQTITYEVVESQSQTLFRRAIAHKNLPFGGTWTWSIEPHDGGGCSVQILGDGDIHNPVFRVVSRVINGLYRHYRQVPRDARQRGEAAKCGCAFFDVRGESAATKRACRCTSLI